MADEMLFHFKNSWSNLCILYNISWDIDQHLGHRFCDWKIMWSHLNNASTCSCTNWFTFCCTFVKFWKTLSNFSLKRNVLHYLFVVFIYNKVGCWNKAGDLGCCLIANLSVSKCKIIINFHCLLLYNWQF